MILQPGASLGVYEIIALLGKGGMGEVYRARDTLLGRDVALKVLSSPLAGAPDQQARFAREARALAALNHPHIAAIYGFESIADTQLLVMELVEGYTLADRLDSARLPLAEALSTARQIAEALEAAHQKGIVHRDLKPANIKITSDGRVKVLDFGLAKATAGAEFDKSLPTAADATRDGAIVGTAPYMSPEQARGLGVDRRTDIWAFGCILYDMIASRRAFDGDTVADILAAVIERDPDFSRVPAATPPDVVRVMRRCLVKDPARRLHDIADARLEIEEVINAPAASSQTAPRIASARGARAMRVGLAVAFIAGGLIAGALLQRYALPSGAITEAPRVTVFGLSEPAGDQLYLFADPIRISPDARQIVMVTNGPEGRSRLWLRSMDAIAPVLLENTDGAIFPFWSPDGRSIAFAAQGELRVLDLTSRAVRSVAPSRGNLAGGAWSPNGTILYVDGFNGLKRVSASGGEPSEVTSTGSTPGTVLHAFPQFLPDGRHFLYIEKSLALSSAGAVMLGDLDSPARTRLLTTESQVIFAPPDHLVYQRQGAFVAVRFNPDRFEITGDPVELSSQGFGWGGGGLMAASVSETGVLAFATRRVLTNALAWVDRSGRPLGTLGDRGWWVHVDISPDEKTVVAERLEPRTGNGVLWTIDRARGVPSRFSLDPSWNLAPVWSATGSRVAFGSSRSGTSDLYMRPGDGSGEDTEVNRSNELTVPTSWTPRDDRLVFNHIAPATGVDIEVVTIDGSRKKTVLVQTPFNEGSGKVSPDGGWLAYASNETGRQEIYVRPFDRPGARIQISTGGGSQPRWRRDGKELFFVSDEGRLMAARVTGGATLDVQPPELLPATVERDITGWRYTYDVVEGGQRFLAIRSAGADPTPPIVVMVNWAAGLRK